MGVFDEGDGARMRYLSVCSGIEAATAAWGGLGWEAAAFSEIDPFPRAVLAHHYPDVPLHGDFTTIGEDDYGSVGLIVGGTPCQSFSVAGLRGGMDDDRGNLALEFIRLIDRKRPRWVVWENVPGVLSSNGGRDFGSLLGALGVIGYGFAYRVLDAQYFGVAQRRRRVFVVAHIGGWQRAAAVLFERQSLSGDIAPRREKGQDVARCTDPSLASGREIIGDYPESVGALCARTGRAMSVQDAEQGHIVEAYPIHDKATRHMGKTGKGSGNGLGVGKDGDPTPTLTTGDHHAVCFAQNSRDELREMPYSGALAANPGMKQTSYVRIDSVVRRLTPIECERLQGFPDNFTQIPYRGKEAGKCPDGPRYKALGNSMAVPVMKWIGERIKTVDTM